MIIEGIEKHSAQGQEDTDYHVERNNKPIIEEFFIQGIPVKFDTSDEHVFNPYPISLLIANAIQVGPDDHILDVGTGSGIFAITAAKLHAKKVVATYIEHRALEAARKNAELNGVADRIEWICGNLIEPVKHQVFDLIVSNLPCMPCSQAAQFSNSGFARAVDAGECGTKHTTELIRNAKSVLSPRGELLIPVAKWCDWKSLFGELQSCGYDTNIVSSGLVQYHLQHQGKAFHAHISRLVDARVVDLVKRQGKLYAEILVCRSHLLNRNKDTNHV